MEGKINDRFSTIRIRSSGESKKVKIGSRLKPALVEGVISKWQSLLDVIVSVIGVPSGLIMRLNEDNIEVFLSSHTPGNPYRRGEKESLVYGLYCETVIGTQEKLHVPDALKSGVWSVNNPDVKIKMISYLGYPVNWPDGEVFGTICILDNKENHFNKTFEKLLLEIRHAIETDLQLLITEQELHAKNVQLQQAIALKDKFFSIIAHDLKDPFNAVLGFSSLLVDQIREKDYDGIEKYSGVIHQSAQSAFDLLVNLLEWSRSQTGRMEFNPVVFDLLTLLEDSSSAYNDIAKQKSLRITKDLPSSMMVCADEHMISSVLRNLFSNAIKFSNMNGEIRLSASKEQNEVIVSLADEGVGMTKEQIDKLFRLDESNSTPGTADEKGTGLGLILCKEFVEKHGGKIRVESGEGKGSRFFFTIPYSNENEKNR